jgi:cytochrome c oxidase subunit II
MPQGRPVGTGEAKPLTEALAPPIVANVPSTVAAGALALSRLTSEDGRTSPGALLGVAGPPSALDPAGRGAEQIADVFWWMSGAAVVIWLAFVALTVYAVHAPRERATPRATWLLIVGGGVIFPTTVLAALLVYGLAALPEHLAAAPPGSLRVHVSGEQFWWRMRYQQEDGTSVDVANELHLPVGEPVQLELDSPDVIHSFWIPALAGKVDMIPGRHTRLKLEPTRTGTFRGVCAEYCGASHAFMSFPVVVEDKAHFAAWLAGQAAPARVPDTPLTRQGLDVFTASGCGACHSIRGTTADGVVGPDLTHVGARLGVADLHRWIAHPAELKPGATMPAFGMLPENELRALAAYLGQLE